MSDSGDYYEDAVIPPKKRTPVRITIPEPSCETCRHNLALFYDPCPECIPEKRSQWEAMPPAAITEYPHYVETEMRCYIEKRQQDRNGKFVMRSNIDGPIYVQFCPGCGGRCL